MTKWLRVAEWQDGRFLPIADDPAANREIQSRVLRAAAEDVYDDACHERILKLADKIASGEVEIQVEEERTDAPS